MAYDLTPEGRRLLEQERAARAAIDPGMIARRWRLRGEERATLRTLARDTDPARRLPKAYFAAVGFELAWIDVGERDVALTGAPLAAFILRRGVYHARRALADCDEARALKFGETAEGLEDAELEAELLAKKGEGYHPHDDDLFGLAAEPHAPGAGETFAAILAIARGQERTVVDTLADTGCTSLADVDRVQGWTHGHARSVARRLVRRAPRSA